MTAYGFWLPNEPRGLWSDFVAAWELRRFGPATTVQTRRPLASQPYDSARIRSMQQALKYPPVQFTGEMAVRIANGFADTPYTLHALSILPKHAHLVIAHEERPIRKIIGKLKAEAKRHLRGNGDFATDRPGPSTGGTCISIPIRRCGADSVRLRHPRERGLASTTLGVRHGL
jgi:hypothetical protein